jgi:gluconokinase
LAGDVNASVVLVVMGVSGSGKTTVAAILAARLGWAFEEGDALHPQANIDKMSAGQPLTDEDRWPWLESIAHWVDERLDAGENGIITCSALKRAYRDAISRRGRGVVFVFLRGSKETIAARMAARQGHFMPSRSMSDHRQGFWADRSSSGSAGSRGRTDDFRAAAQS